LDASTALDFANGLYARKMYAAAASEYEKFIRENPASPEVASARFRLADSLYFTRDYASAIARFEDFLREHAADPRAVMARFRVGTARFHTGDIDSAIAAFRPLTGSETDPAIRAGTLYYLGKCYEARPADGDVLSTYGRLLKEHPGTEYAAYAGIAVGDYHAQRGNDALALDAYAVIAREAKFKTGEIHLRRKDYAAATAVFEKVLEESAAHFRASGEAASKSASSEALLRLLYADARLKRADVAARRLAEHADLIAGTPAEADVHYVTAEIFAEKGDVAGALERLEKTLAHPKTGPQLAAKALFRKSSVLEKAERHDEAIAALQGIFDAGQEGVDRAYYEKGAILEAAGRPTEALLAYRALLDRYGSSEYAKAALYRGALLQAKGGDAAAARDSFEEFRRRYPDDPDAPSAFLETIQIDLDAKQFARAAVGAAEFAGRYPQSPYLDIALYKAAIAHAGAGDHAKAAESFTAVVDRFPASKLMPEALYGAALSRESLGRHAEAIPYYERLVNEHPGHALAKEVLSRLGHLYIKVENYDKVAAFYEDILFSKPDVKVHIDGVWWLVQRLLDRGEYERMRRILEAVPARFPGENHTHGVRFFLGESALGLKELDAALEHYRAAIAADPKGLYAAHAHLGIGLVHALRGDAAAAERSFAEALAFDDTKVAMRARLETANLRLKAGAYEEAAKGFMLVAILYDDPKHVPTALYKAGECFSKIGRADEASKAFAELRERYPDSEWTRKLKPAPTAEVAHA
jgi:TolA-binding protein